jgi:TRAP-type mannitol/chloroaromatic compound transport system substrate-binding protein
MRSLVRKQAALLAVLTLLLAGQAASAAETLTLNIASTFPGNMPILGEAARRLSDKVHRASGGEIALRFHEPNVIVRATETVNAVANGTVPGAWAGAGWFAGKDSAFNMFSTIPFGPGIGEYLAWLYFGGGLDMAREMFHANNVHNIPCIIIPPEASGWFRKEIKSVEDLRGLRMRFFGLGAKVMQKLGVVTNQLPPGEILEAMKSGLIDATEFSLPAIDKPLGFQTVAKFYYFPGWHQQATFFDLYVNKTKWDALSDRHKAIIELACGDTMRESIAEGEAAQGKAMKEMQAEGVQLKRWPPEILQALEKAWQEVLAEESAKSPNFKRVYASFSSFRQNYAIWREYNQLD